MGDICLRSLRLSVAAFLAGSFLALCAAVAGCGSPGSGPPRIDGGEDAPITDAGGDASAFDAGGDSGTQDAGTNDAGGSDAGPTSVTVFQVQDPDAAGHVMVGARVRITGAIVAAVDAFEENGAGMGNVSDVWVADAAGGPFSGLHVYMPAHTTCSGRPALGLGDTVDVEGTVQEFSVPSDGSGRTVTQLIAGTVTCTTAGTGVGPLPAVISDPGALTIDASAEPWEGVLVELRTVEATADPDRFGTESLRIGPPLDDDLYAHPGSRRDRFITLRGIFHYMFGRWEILPRAATDIVLDAPRTVEDGSGAWGCGDAEDSDGDGSIDCADADCSTSRFCAGVTVTVEDVQDTTRPAHPAVASAVALVGPLVVTSIDTYAEMAGPGYTGTVVVEDPAAIDPRHSGIHVYVPTIEPCGAALALGDRVYVAGRYEEYAEVGDTGSLTEIRNGIVSCRMPGTPLVPTSIAAPSDLASAATAEPWEGVLVEIADVDVTMAAGMFGRFQVTGGAYVDDDVYRSAVLATDHLARVAGVLSYSFEYQLEPRMIEDVVIGPSEHDDTTCGNGIDDDADGSIDCSDVDCCDTAPCGGAVTGRRLILSEVLYDATGADDTHEWVELRNAGTSAVPLACYALGNGALSYRYSLAQLPPIVVPAGGCVLVGGPDCGGMPCTASLDFTPDFHNGTAGSASGVALLYGLASGITDAMVPVDAVLYGTANTGMLRDATGAVPASANVIDVAAGHSIARDAAGAWMDVTVPTPGTCTTFTP